MYEDLVKRLRTCGNSLSCNKCKWRPECDGISEAFRKAADAIEKLQEDSVPIDDMEMILSEVAKPRWIPVTERLPEDMVDVLCYYEYFRYGNYNRMFRTIDRGHVFEGRWFGEAGEGHKNKVFAWMPLPEPPKEEH